VNGPVEPGKSHSQLMREFGSEDDGVTARVREFLTRFAAGEPAR
jgi:hypothetical protein